MSSPRPIDAVLRRAVALSGCGLLAGAGLAGVKGLGAVWKEGYLGLGFSRNALMLGTGWLPEGLTLGLLWAVLTLAALALHRTLKQPIDALLASRFLLAAAAIACAGILATVQAVPAGLVGAAVASALTGLFILRQSSAHDHAFVANLGTLLLAGGPAAALLWWRLGEQLPFEGRRESLAALLLLAALLPIGAALLALANRAGRAAWSCLLPWLPVACLLALSLWAPQSRGALTPRNPQNVVIVLVDTLREDFTTLTRSDAHGFGDLTPALTALRQRSTSFSNAISQAPWTLPATASILTGKYPGDHGARGFTSKLESSELTLAEVLTESGYDTAAVVSNSYLRDTYGLHQGFANFDQEIAKSPSIFWDITSSEVTDRALTALEAAGGDRPFLLLAHYFDPHASYRDHDGTELATGYSGWLEKPVHTQGELDLRVNAYRLDEDDVDYLEALYAEEVAHTDREIDRLLRGLDERGLTDDTVIVFVSDHGEEFFERGWVGHTVHLSDEMVRVPFAVSLPGVPQPPRIDSVVETRAVFGTLLDHLGVEAPGAQRPSLLDALRGGELVSDLAFTEVRTAREHTAWPARTALTALRTPEWKLIYRHLDDAYELYDLVADPKESVDVAGERPEAEAELRALLDAWIGSMDGGPEDAERELSPEALEQLKALGYIN